MTPAPNETELRVSTLTLDLAGQCADLERLAFPHADAAELLSEDDIKAYTVTFPQGFFVVMDGDLVVGQGAGIFLDFDFSHPQHTIAEITGEHQCANHNPDGEWYYGTDIAVHPRYRRRGIGRRLYQLRKDLVRRSNKRGIIAGAHIPGFADHKRTMSAEDYAAKVAGGVLYDPTLSFQLDNGFQIKGMLENYLRDDSTDSWSVLIVWDNPSFEPPGKK